MIDQNDHSSIEMQHLNIPLSRSNQTTRRTRWVVWLLAFVFLFVGATTYWASSLWLTRDTIYSASPENTTSAVRFFVSGNKGALVESTIGKIPLISDRSITFSDLAPYISGEFVIFFNEDGSRSIAIRLGKTQLPQTFLDSQGVTVQTIGHNIVLLSNKEQSIKPFILKPKLYSGLSYPGHVWIGEFLDIKEKQRSFIYATREGIEITLSGSTMDSQPFKKIPTGTIAYLSTPSLTKTSTDLLEPISALTQFIEDKTISNTFNQITNTKSRIILTKDKDGIGFFVESNQKDSNTEQMLQTIAALNKPKVQETPLDDGTTIREIIADPATISVERVTVLGTQISRIQTNNGTLLAGTVDSNNFFLTNREILFRSMKNQGALTSKICSGNIGGISLRTLNETLLQNIDTPNNNVILLFSQNFSGLGIESGLFSTKIKLCH